MLHICAMVSKGGINLNKEIKLNNKNELYLDTRYLGGGTGGDEWALQWEREKTHQLWPIEERRIPTTSFLSIFRLDGPTFVSDEPEI